MIGEGSRAPKDMRGKLQLNRPCNARKAVGGVVGRTCKYALQEASIKTYLPFILDVLGAGVSAKDQSTAQCDSKC